MTPHDTQSAPSETMSTSNSSEKASSEAPPGVELCQFPAMIYTYTVNHANGASSFPYVSEYCETLFGYTADNLVEHPELLMNSVHEEDSEKFTKSVIESMQNMTVWDFVFRMTHKDGSVRNVHGKSKPELITQEDEEGNSQTLTKWSGVLLDVTEKEKNNQVDRAEMRALMTESMAPIFGIDCSGIIYKWNHMMSRLTGFSTEEAMGNSLFEFMNEDERGSIIMLLGSIQRARETLSGETEKECCLITKEKKPLHLFVKCITRHGTNGEIAGVAFVGQDITKVKEAEKKKDAALKLVDAEKGLTEWLSHEVRNPLSIATEAAEALKEDDIVVLNPESASHVDLISQSLSYIVELLTDMLDLNKCIEGKVTLQSKQCNIKEEVLIPTRDMMNVRSKDVQVKVVGGEGIKAVLDSLRLRQVVTNLVSNSLKFTTVGFVKICLTKCTTRMGDTVLLKVRDSGCGISPDHHGSLFSKWEQLGSRTNGTGIGLCLCQALIRVMGGHISLNPDYVSGIEGHPGAEFVIELPVNSILGTSKNTDEKSSPVNTFDAVSRAVVAARTGDTPQKDGVSVRGEDTGSLTNAPPESRTQPKTGIAFDKRSCVTGKYHVLIVDDDRVGRKFIRRRFQRLFPDAVVEEAVSGEEAVAKARERDTQYDIITMDHFMGIGDMNGAETIQALRDDKVDALIIGISGNTKKEEHLNAGAEDFLQKPIPSDETIIDMLLTHLAPPSGWGVLTVDDVKMNRHFMSRKLQKISSPHFTDMSVAEKRWNITAAATGIEAVELLRSQSFDLVVLDHHLGDGMNGVDVGRFVREHAVNKEAIIVLNSGSTEGVTDDGSPFNLFWPKPLPKANQMRMNLCCELLSQQRSDSFLRQQSSVSSRQDSELSC